MTDKIMSLTEAKSKLAQLEANYPEQQKARRQAFLARCRALKSHIRVMETGPPEPDIHDEEATK